MKNVLLAIICLLTFSCTKKNDFVSIEYGRDFTKHIDGSFQVIKIFPNGNYRFLVVDRNDSNRREFSGIIPPNLMDSIAIATNAFRDQKGEFFRRNINSGFGSAPCEVNSGLLISGENYNASSYWQDQYHEEPEMKKINEMTGAIGKALVEICDKYRKGTLTACSDTTHFQTYDDLKTKF